jgi:poly-beta-1,6-N-acetyl-D-glucosamine synthase
VLFVVLYFQVFLILTFMVDKKRKSKYKTPTNMGYFPSTTIIVPCFNEERTVASTLDSLLALEYPKEKLSIIAVDDGSSDGTWQILQRYRDSHGIKILKKENGGKHTALNLALQQTNSELVGCLDADSFVHPEALSKIAPYFKDQETMAVTPAIVVHNPSNILQHIQKAEYNIGLFVRRMLCNLNALHVTPGPFSIFRKAVFDKIGGYRHGHNTEDMELAMRMQKHHMKIENSIESLVYTVTPRTLRALYKQRVRWVYGFLKNTIDHKDVFFKKEFGNFGIVNLPFSFFSIFAGIYLFSFMIYQLGFRIYQKIEEVSVVGLDLTPNFNWFFFNTEMMLFLGTFLVAMTLLILVVGKKMAREKGLVSGDIILFLVFYTFISPFWFMRAVYNTAVSKSTSWR